MDDLQIAWRPLGELIPYARNPRTHTDAQVAQIAASIREFGWTNPVLVDGANGIIAGHGRVLAARKLGLERVPVIELAHMSEAQKRAYVLADNQLALNAGWDEALLRLELADLSELGFDLGLIGFGEGELERLLAGGGRAGLTEDDEAPALPEQAVTSRAICGCWASTGCCAATRRCWPTSSGCWRALADMTFTDPPYNVDYGSSPRTSCAGNNAEDPERRSRRRLRGVPARRLRQHPAVTKGAVYVCMSSELHTLQRAFTAAGGKWTHLRDLGEAPSLSAAPITSGSTNRSCTAGATGTTTTGAVLGTRATSGSSTSRRGTTCIRP